MTVLLQEPVAETSLADMSAADLGRLYRSGDVSPIDVIDNVLNRIDEIDNAVNAFVHLDPETTRAMAVASDARFRADEALGPLDGIPTSIKDLAPVAGWPLRRGSLALGTDPVAEDSPPVARLREAGCVFIGKTATPESGSRIVTRSDVHGVTLNPWNESKTPGGSSGGAAAALALGMGALALGTDGAGSIRIPAAYCNLAGLKPGFGRVPSYPPSIFMPHSVTGPMARTVEDVALMTSAMAMPEPRDPYAWPVPFDLGAALSNDISGLRVAVSPTLGTPGRADPATVDAVMAAADALRAAGATVETADPLWPVDPYDPFMVFWEATYAGFLDMYPEDQAAKMSPLLQEIAARGRDIGQLTYHKALNDRVAIAAAAQGFFNDFDAVLSPVMPGPAFDVEAEAPDGEEPDDWRWCPFTYVFNMTGQPAVSVPAGFTDDGLPIGVQLASGVGREEVLFRLAHKIEAARPMHLRRPPMLEALT